MVFSSLMFLFLYLPITLAVYYLSPLHLRNLVLLVLNLIFYAWGEPIYVVIMIASILIDYSHGLLITKHRANDKLARCFVFSSIAFNLGLLGFFKYADFFINNLNQISFFASLGLEPFALALPIGISFYTFQTMSYTIDVYRNDAAAQKNIISFGTYVTLFPQLIAGPIVKYKDVAEQIDNRRESVIMFADGVKLFVVGLAKKVLIANNIGMLWDSYKVMNVGDLSIAGAWLGVLAFGFQIYFDFSGYSDMARGLGKMFGFDFKINFNYPFIAKNVSDFWRRWHISLGSWFKEYVYFPLGGNRVNIPRQYINLFAVWFLTGFWHGASWNYILWGLYFFVFIMLEKAFILKGLAKLPSWFSNVYLLVIISISWPIFAIESVPAMLSYMAVMFGMTGAPLVDGAFIYYLNSYFVILIAIVIGVTPLPKMLWNKLGEGVQKWAAPILIVIAMIIVTAYLVDSSYNPFLYFRF